MPTFQSVVKSIDTAEKSGTERQRLISAIEDLTGRRLLVYVGDVRKSNSMLSMEDKTGFSDMLEGIESNEVDILINSPGGYVEAAEAIVCMLRDQFEHVRFAVPNMAKSAATLLALSGDQLMMDQRSELGPIDPQIQYRWKGELRREAADDILTGFERARDTLAQAGPSMMPAYVPLLDKYTPGLLQACESAKALSEALAKQWLKQYMFRGDSRSRKPSQIAKFLASRSRTLSHARPIGIETCLEKSLKILDLRKPENAELGQLLWELWCVCELHFERSPVFKMYENSSGCTLNKQAGTIKIVAKNPQKQ